MTAAPFPSLWHQNALKGQFGPVHDGEPETGYFRDKSGDRIVYWLDSHDGRLRCQRNGKDVDAQRAGEIWQFINRNPVTEEAFYFHADNGRWPDQDAAAANSGKATEIDPATDPLGAAKEQAAKAKATLETYATIDSDEQAAAAQTLRDELNKIANALDKDREKLVRPHLDAQQQINGDWNPIIKDLKASATKLRSAMEAWENDKRDAARRAAEAAARELDRAIVRNEEPAPPPPSNMPAPAAQIKGASGKAANVGSRKVVTLENIDLAFAALKTDKNLIDFITALAQKRADMDIETPGCRIDTKAKIR